MSKKVHPKTKVLTVDRPQLSNSSIAAINSSYLHQGYYSRNDNSKSLCQCCKQVGNSSLIQFCDCQDKLFHHMCFGQQLIDRLQNKKVSVIQQDDYRIINCNYCHAKIRFRSITDRKCRSCSQMGDYLTSHKGIAALIICTVILLLSSILIILLTILGVISFQAAQIEQSAVFIGLGIMAGILLILFVCCSLDCVWGENTKIEAMYDKNGRNIRSGKSKRSRRSSRKVTVSDIE